jgi:hypothetical protein
MMGSIYVIWFIRWKIFRAKKAESTQSNLWICACKRYEFVQGEFWLNFDCAWLLSLQRAAAAWTWRRCTSAACNRGAAPAVTTLIPHVPTAATDDVYTTRLILLESPLLAPAVTYGSAKYNSYNTGVYYDSSRAPANGHLLARTLCVSGEEEKICGIRGGPALRAWAKFSSRFTIHTHNKKDPCQ